MRVKYKKIMAEIIERRKRARQNSLRNSQRESKEDKTKARTSAVFGTINARSRRIRGTIKPSFNEASMNAIRSKIMPKIGSRTKVRVVRTLRRLPIFRGMPKRKLVQEAFGVNGERLGLLLINPEMFPFSADLKNFLTALGCRIIFSKNIIFSKSVLYEVYAKELREIPAFAIKATNLLNGLSKVLVFKQLSPEELMRKSKYLQRLHEENPEKFHALVEQLNGSPPVKVFDTLYKGPWKELTRGTIRADVVATRLDSLGLRSGTGVANLLDPFGFFRKKIAEGRNPYTNLTGIHTPASIEELFRNAEAFLTKSDILRIIDKP